MKLSKEYIIVEIIPTHSNAKVGFIAQLQALKIKSHAKSYINEVFSWDYTVYDLLSISYFYQGLYDEALFYSSLALKMSPKDERLLNNLEIIKKVKENESTK